MKRPLIGIACVILASTCGLFVGCKLVGSNPAPPTHFEQGLFDAQTNYEAQVSFQTNAAGLVFAVTNQVPRITLTPKKAVTDAIQGTTGTIGTFVPIAGTIGGILVGVLGAWSRIRSAKRTGAVLAQNIQTLREFLKTLPDGAKIDAAVKAFLSKNQEEENTLTDVLALVNKYVDSSLAKRSVAEIQEAVNALKQP